MGGRQSTGASFTVSMDNQNPIIDVSDEVVQRLKLGIKKAKTATTSTASQTATKQEESTSAVRTAAATVVSSPATATPSPPVRSIYAVPSQSSSPAPSMKSQTSTANAAAVPSSIPYLSAMEERRQKEIELQQNDQMWRNRMAMLEQTLNKTNAIMEKEYSTTMDDVRKRFTNPTGGHKIPPCQDLKAQLIACYRTYPNETLKCSDEVARFRHCIGMNRVQKLDAIETANAAGTASAVKPPKAA